jgi:hypothetical protein
LTQDDDQPHDAKQPGQTQGQDQGRHFGREAQDCPDGQVERDRPGCIHREPRPEVVACGLPRLGDELARATVAGSQVEGDIRDEDGIDRVDDDTADSPRSEPECELKRDDHTAEEHEDQNPRVPCDSEGRVLG